MNLLFLDIGKQNQFLNSIYFDDKNILNADLWTFNPKQTTTFVYYSGTKY